MKVITEDIATHKQTISASLASRFRNAVLD